MFRKHGFIILKLIHSVVLANPSVLHREGPAEQTHRESPSVTRHSLPGQPEVRGLRPSSFQHWLWNKAVCKHTWSGQVGVSGLKVACGVELRQGQKDWVRVGSTGELAGQEKEGPTSGRMLWVCRRKDGG